MPENYAANCYQSARNYAIKENKQIKIKLRFNSATYQCLLELISEKKGLVKTTGKNVQYTHKHTVTRIRRKISANKCDNV